MASSSGPLPPTLHINPHPKFSLLLLVFKDQVLTLLLNLKVLDTLPTNNLFVYTTLGWFLLFEAKKIGTQLEILHCPVHSPLDLSSACLRNHPLRGSAPTYLRSNTPYKQRRPPKFSLCVSLSVIPLLMYLKLAFFFSETLAHQTFL